MCFSALLRIKTQFYTFLSMGGLGGWEGNDRLQQLKKKKLLVAGSFPWEDFQKQEMLKVYITKFLRLVQPPSTVQLKVSQREWCGGRGGKQGK